MAAIHTSLLYELESKGDIEREISDKIQSHQLGMLKSYQHTYLRAHPTYLSTTLFRELSGMGLKIGNAMPVHVEKRCFVNEDMV